MPRATKVVALLTTRFWAMLIWQKNDFCILLPSPTIVCVFVYLRQSPVHLWQSSGVVDYILFGNLCFAQNDVTPKFQAWILRWMPQMTKIAHSSGWFFLTCLVHHIFHAQKRMIYPDWGTVINPFIGLVIYPWWSLLL